MFHGLMHMNLLITVLSRRAKSKLHVYLHSQFMRAPQCYSQACRRGISVRFLVWSVVIRFFRTDCTWLVSRRLTEIAFMPQTYATKFLEYGAWNSTVMLRFVMICSNHQNHTHPQTHTNLYVMVGFLLKFNFMVLENRKPKNNNNLVGPSQLIPEYTNKVMKKRFWKFVEGSKLMKIF